MEFKFIFLKYQTWVLLLFSNNQSSLFLAAIIRKNDYFCGKKYHARYVPLWKRYAHTEDFCGEARCW
ncbi:hypothetical protein [Coprobacter fastidiosus]|uniref:hypothetical protein n=1 Tax=Coprobacter fastidiosus TaxID=1099853 RepID=UPI00241FA38A|nr:hypothetical protein [Coprobacter fastidiosus]